VAPRCALDSGGVCKPPPYTHTHVFNHAQDPCNFPELTKKKFNTENLWPSLQTRALQDSSKPPTSNIALGDGRINPFVTSYSTGEL